MSQQNTAQNRLLIIVAALFGLYFSSVWGYDQVKVILTLIEFDLSVNWVLYLALLFFYVLIFCFSLLVLGWNLHPTKLKELWQGLALRQLFFAGILFNGIVALLALANDVFFKIEDQSLAALLPIGLLAGLYFFSRKKVQLSPFYFLFGMAVISFAIWYPLYRLF